MVDKISRYSQETQQILTKKHSSILNPEGNSLGGREAKRRGRLTAVSKRIEFDLQVKASYKSLWKLLVDKDKLKQDLREEAKLSSTTMARLNNGDNVTTDVLLRICQVLNCQIGDIVEIIPKEEP